MDLLMHATIVGVGATLLMDTWGALRQPLLGWPQLDYALLGRWFGHMPRGQFRHEAIARATPVRGERLIGWTMHYLIGIGFAALLLVVAGTSWLERPRLAPALIVGVVTVVAPLFIMQPAMGMGIAASRAPRPNVARVQSVITHVIYGVGLYLAGWLEGLVIG